MRNRFQGFWGVGGVASDLPCPSRQLLAHCPMVTDLALAAESVWGPSLSKLLQHDMVTWGPMGQAIAQFHTCSWIMAVAD